MRAGIAFALLVAVSINAHASKYPQPTQPPVGKYLQDAIMSCKTTSGFYDAARRGLVPVEKAEKAVADQEEYFRNSFLAAVQAAANSPAVAGALKSARTQELACVQAMKPRPTEDAVAYATRTAQAQTELDVAVAAVRTEIDLAGR